jgi:hypothetical protein
VASWFRKGYPSAGTRVQIAERACIGTTTLRRIESGAGSAFGEAWGYPRRSTENPWGVAPAECQKLKSMIDDAIGKQVARSERRQVAYSVIIGVLSLAAGWLLSAISPLSALAQLLPR